MSQWENERIKAMLRDIWKTEDTYQEQIAEYKKKDGYMAVTIWLLLMVLYYLMGQLYAREGVYIGTIVNIILAILCVSLVFVRKEKISSIGFNKNNVVKSIITGSILGLLIVAFNILLNLIQGRTFAPLQNIIINLVYYMVVISLVEEIIFRGYIQTRLYGLVKRPMIARILGALFFMLMHIPFQMGYANMELVAYVQMNWITLVFTFAWHMVFDFLYRKYNAIYAPTIFHGFMNWSNYLFL
jgi:membrane protease YdiL (CAAX protease family)